MIQRNIVSEVICTRSCMLLRMLRQRPTIEREELKTDIKPLCVRTAARKRAGATALLFIALLWCRAVWRAWFLYSHLRGGARGTYAHSTRSRTRSLHGSPAAPSVAAANMSLSGARCRRLVSSFVPVMSFRFVRSCSALVPAGSRFPCGWFALVCPCLSIGLYTQGMQLIRVRQCAVCSPCEERPREYVQRSVSRNA